MPYTIKERELYSIFGQVPVNLYYSMYSLLPRFRQRWIPNALPVNVALDKLKLFQDLTMQPINFHWAFIKGENDNPKDVETIANLLKSYGFYGKFNLVRYNPPDHTSEETDEDNLRILFSIMNGAFNKVKDGKSKIVPRVGKDVYASCGMFEPDYL